MKVAALDLGSNTFLCLIASVDSGEIKEVHCDELRFVRLGQGVDKSGEFHPEAIQRARETLSEFKDLCQKEGVEKIQAVATSAARDAKNKEEFFDILTELEIPVEIISGDREAELTFLGALSQGQSGEGVVVVDVGGGSTEIIVKNKQGALQGASLDIGAVRLTERCVSSHPISKAEVDSMRRITCEHLGQWEERNPGLKEQIQEVIAVAGTPTTLACLEIGEDYNPDKVHQHILTLDNLKNWGETMAGESVEERKKRPTLPAGRADVIVAGTMILEETLRFFQQSAMTVSVQGVRYGLAATMS